MKNFSSEFKTPEQYILDITYKIWEERGIGRIHDWYAADGPVRSPHGVTNSVEDVVKHTLETMHEFPDRELFGEDVIIGDKGDSFLSSHRVRSTATHLGNGAFGKASGRPITALAIADCLCKDNQIVEEWLLRDTAGVVRQLGGDIEAHGRAMGAKNPEPYMVGNAEMHTRWSAPNGFVIDGDKRLGEKIVAVYDSIWNGKDLSVMDDAYDRALRFEGPAGLIRHGRTHAGDHLTGILSSIPDGRLEPQHVIVKQVSDRPVRVALRWSYGGTFSGHGKYGEPTGCPLAILGISHFELRDGKILNECMVIDETAVYAQIAAYNQ